MKQVQVQVLSKEAFAPYGIVLETGECMTKDPSGACDWGGNLCVMEGIESSAFNLMTVYPREATFRKFECHEKTAEAVIPLGGRGIIIPLAPPGVVTEETVTAFYVPGNKAVVFHPGTWHYWPFTYEESATFITTYRAATPEDDVYFAELPEKMSLTL